MYKGPLTHSLHCSEFVELTLNKYADSISQDKIKKMTSYLFEYDVTFA